MESELDSTLVNRVETNGRLDALQTLQEGTMMRIEELCKKITDLDARVLSDSIVETEITV